MAMADFSGAMTEFSDCPRLDSRALTPSALWELMARDPRPRLLTGAPLDVDVIALLGARRQSGGFAFDELPPLPDDSPYRLLNPPDKEPRGVFAMLRARYPLPLLGDAFDLCPLLSIGRRGTGQTDLARHYHSATAMLLLQGEKLWALRPPDDAQCARSCPDPFDVCAFYASAAAPAPRCVQRAGETLLLPDGWYHGTCNRAEWTVGWGGNCGRRLPTAAAAAAAARFALSGAALVGAADARQVERRLLAAPRAAALDGARVEAAGGGGRAAALAARAFALQFANVSMGQALDELELMGMECTAFVIRNASVLPAAVWPRLAERGAIHLYVQLGAATSAGTTLSFRLPGSSQLHSHDVAPQYAAVWSSGALAGISRIRAARSACDSAMLCSVRRKPYRYARSKLCSRPTELI
ncbi:hypothetical protein AB1Y20_004308 [Prymnesium parvum]|uniref:JmjC domain-containing protein n=1 Tax=Prymnesium parvum TaxID=97485 RepID=A0AB34IYW6_PRYPA